MSIATRPADAVDSDATPSPGSFLAKASGVLRFALSTRTDALAHAYAKWATVELRDFEIGSGLTVSAPPGADKAGLFLVWDLEDPGGSRWPHQALVVHSAALGWYVNWVLSQCTSCLGVGVVGDGPGVDELCGTCGGGGWGLLNSVEYPYLPDMTVPN